MLSVKGIYEDGQVRLLEPIPKKKAKVIVTVLEDKEAILENETDPHLFDDMIGVIDERSGGAREHDQYPRNL